MKQQDPLRAGKSPPPPNPSGVAKKEGEKKKKTIGATLKLVNLFTSDS